MGKHKIEYKSVSTHTLEGLKQAERLKASGWTIVRTGLFMVWFERKSKELTRV